MWSLHPPEERRDSVRSREAAPNKVLNMYVFVNNDGGSCPAYCVLWAGASIAEFSDWFSNWSTCGSTDEDEIRCTRENLSVLLNQIEKSDEANLDNYTLLRF